MSIGEGPYSIWSNLAGAAFWGFALFFAFGGGYLLLSGVAFVAGLLLPVWLFPGT